MKDVKIEWVPTEENLEDLLTKSLSMQNHNCYMEQYGIRYMSDWL